MAPCRDQEIVAFLPARRRSEEGAGFVDVLGVRPDQQGRGAGTALLRAALAVWAAAGLREARLDVSSENPRALRPYQRLG